MPRWIPLAICLALIPPTVCASTIHVPGDHPTIQAAIDAAAHGDVILIAPGRYEENLVVALGKTLDLVGTAGADATIVDGGRLGSVLRFSGGVVEGLTLRNGRAHEGGGLSLQGDAPMTVRNCVIRDNEGWDPECPTMECGRGGGIFLGPGHGAVTIESSSILDNGAGGWLVGAAIHEGRDGAVIRDLLIRDNLIGGNAAGPGAAVHLRRGTLLRNRVVGSSCDGVWISEGECRSNTVVGNAGAGIVAGDAVVVAHNLVVGNGANGDVTVGGIVGGTPECNDSWNNTGGDYVDCDTLGRHDISADPLFCGPGDYRISTESPCHDLGACGLIGALPPGCGATAARPATWGALKSRYR